MTKHRRTSLARSLRTGSAAACALGLVLLSGCTSDDDSSEGGDAAAAESSSAADSTDAPASTQVFPDMGEDFRGVLADVQTDACPTKAGEVEARGTVVNSASEPQDLFIGVIWLRGKSGDSVALGEFTAKAVPAGETVDWTVAADLPRKAGRCVLQAKANAAGTLE